MTDKPDDSNKLYPVMQVAAVATLDDDFAVVRFDYLDDPRQDVTKPTEGRMYVLRPQQVEFLIEHLQNAAVVLKFAAKFRRNTNLH